MLAHELADIYRTAAAKASGETGLAETTFPGACPYAPEQILADDFLPE